MVQQTTTVTNTAKSGQIAAQSKKIDMLKNMLNAPSVVEQFRNTLAKNAPTFVASIIDLYNSDSKLQECEPKKVVMEALKAAALHLPINKALGYAYLVPFNNSKKDEHGNWHKVMEPVFQLGYKGFIQLAMRTGQYRTLNADVVYEGELRKVNKLTGEIAFDGERASDKVVGYFCYFELMNGFSKTLYMTVEQMARHAKRYSKGIVAYDGQGNRTEKSIDDLIRLANIPVVSDNNNVGWLGNFHGMAIKTVIRLLLGKYGYLSVEMQNAIAYDYEGDEDNAVTSRDKLTANNGQRVINMEDVHFEEVQERPGTKETEPAY